MEAFEVLASMNIEIVSSIGGVVAAVIEGQASDTPLWPLRFLRTLLRKVPYAVAVWPTGTETLLISHQSRAVKGNPPLTRSPWAHVGSHQPPRSNEPPPPQLEWRARSRAHAR